MSKQTDLITITDGIATDSSGNVGIGDPNSEGYKLEVSTQNNAANLMLHKRAATGAGFATNLAMQVTQTNGQSARLAEIGANFASGWGGELHFATKSANSSSNNSTTERMKIDAAGRVTKPYQPAFRTKKAASGFVLNDETYVFDTVLFDVGSGYSTSTGRYTCPVAGTYMFMFQSIFRGNITSLHIQYLVNGSRIDGGDTHHSTNEGNVWHTAHSNQILLLAQNDYVEIYASDGGANINFHGSEYAHYSGYLLG